MKKALTVLACAAVVLAAFNSCKKSNSDNGGSLINPDDNGGKTETVSSLSGSDYAVVVLDETSLGKISSKVAVNLGPDNSNSFLYVWSETYTGGTCSGVNFYGEAAEWTSLVVTSVGWSGCGFFIKSEPAGLADWRTRVAADPSSYYLHFALKPGKATDIHRVQVVWGSTQYAAGLGGDYNDNGTISAELKPLSGTYTPGEWNEYEISVAEMGINFNQALKDDGDNYLTFLSGSVEGTQLDLDAVFFYKK